MIDNTDRYFMELAMKEAELAAAEFTIPVGAVLVGPDWQLISKERNNVFSGSDATGHAEMNTIRQASGLVLNPSSNRNYTLFSTLEPCMMCTGAILLSSIKRVVYALPDPNYGALQKIKSDENFTQKFDKIEVVHAPFSDLQLKQRELMIAWDRKMGNSFEWPKPKEM